MQNFKSLASFCTPAGWFELRFSQDEAMLQGCTRKRIHYCVFDKAVVIHMLAVIIFMGRTFSFLHTC